MMMYLCFIFSFFLLNGSAAETPPSCPGVHNNPCSLHGICAYTGLVKDGGKLICHCEWGYHTDDCSKKLCPHGVDPFQKGKANKSIRLSITAHDGKALMGKVLLSFHHHTVEMELKGKDTSSSLCAAAVGRLQPLRETTCERTDEKGSSSLTFEITLVSFPTIPIMNNLFHHNGNPKIEAFECDTLLVTGSSNVECRFENIVHTHIHEYIPCANHGVCDDHAGRCLCHPGFYGSNCDSNVDDTVVWQGQADGIYFTGTVAHLATSRSPSDEFQIITSTAGEASLFSINGLGDITLNEGSVTVEKGNMDIQEGSLQVHGPLVVHDTMIIEKGGLHIKQDMEKPSSLLTLEGDLNHPMLDIKATGTGLASLVHMSVNGTTRFKMEAHKTLLKGPLELDTVRVNGPLHVQGPSSGLYVHDGNIHVQGGNLVVTDGDASIQEGKTTLSSSSGSLLSLSNTKPTNENPLLAMNTHDGAPFLVASGANQDVRFEIAASGQLTAHGGVVVPAGGVSVTTGGVHIDSGGLTIEHGGLIIKEGGITIPSHGFTIGDGGLSVSSTALGEPVLHVKGLTATAARAALLVEIPQEAVEMPFLHAVRGEELVVAVDGRGNVNINGNFTQPKHQKSTLGTLMVTGPLLGDVSAITSFSSSISIPLDTFMVHVVDDGVDEPLVELHFDGEPTSGQVLIVHNSDSQALPSAATHEWPSLPAHSTTFLVYTGEAWHTLHPLSDQAATVSSHFNERVGTDESSDMNLGSRSLIVESLQLTGQRPGRIAIFGKGGTITSDVALGYDVDTDILSVSTLAPQHMIGRVNLTDCELAGATLLGGTLHNVNLHAKSIVGTGDLRLEGVAYLGGATVHGPVMGSGAYVDTSDARFKMNIHPLVNALDKIVALRGVTYHFNTTAFPHRHFSTNEQIGFLANDVLAVEPLLVEKDNDGYLHLSYGHFAPLLVEGMKEQQDVLLKTSSELEELRAMVQEQKEKVERLENHVASLLHHLEKDCTNVLKQV